MALGITPLPDGDGEGLLSCWRDILLPRADVLHGYLRRSTAYRLEHPDFYPSCSRGRGNLFSQGLVLRTYEFQNAFIQRFGELPLKTRRWIGLKSDSELLSNLDLNRFRLYQSGCNGFCNGCRTVGPGTVAVYVMVWAGTDVVATRYPPTRPMSKATTITGTTFIPTGIL